MRRTSSSASAGCATGCGPAMDAFAPLSDVLRDDTTIFFPTAATAAGLAAEAEIVTNARGVRAPDVAVGCSAKNAQLPIRFVS